MGPEVVTTENKSNAIAAQSKAIKSKKSSQLTTKSMQHNPSTANSIQNKRQKRSDSCISSDSDGSESESSSTHTNNNNNEMRGSGVAHSTAHSASVNSVAASGSNATTADSFKLSSKDFRVFCRQQEAAAAAAAAAAELNTPNYVLDSTANYVPAPKTKKAAAFATPPAQLTRQPQSKRAHLHQTQSTSTSHSKGNSLSLTSCQSQKEDEVRKLRAQVEFLKRKLRE